MSRCPAAAGLLPALPGAAGGSLCLPRAEPARLHPAGRGLCSRRGSRGTCLQHKPETGRDAQTGPGHPAGFLRVNKVPGAGHTGAARCGSGSRPGLSCSVLPWIIILSALRKPGVQPQLPPPAAAWHWHPGLCGSDPLLGPERMQGGMVSEPSVGVQGAPSASTVLRVREVTGPSWRVGVVCDATPSRTSMTARVCKCVCEPKPVQEPVCVHLGVFVNVCVQDGVWMLTHTPGIVQDPALQQGIFHHPAHPGVGEPSLLDHSLQVQTLPGCLQSVPGQVGWPWVRSACRHVGLAVPPLVRVVG